MYILYTYGRERERERAPHKNRAKVHRTSNEAIGR